MRGDGRGLCPPVSRSLTEKKKRRREKIGETKKKNERGAYLVVAGGGSVGVGGLSKGGAHRKRACRKEGGRRLERHRQRGRRGEALAGEGRLQWCCRKRRPDRILRQSTEDEGESGGFAGGGGIEGRREERTRDSEGERESGERQREGGFVFETRLPCFLKKARGRR